VKTSTNSSAAGPVRHVALALADPPPSEVGDLARAALTRRVVIYAGAGLSVAPPACGPTGWLVASRLRPYVAQILGVDEAELGSLALEELAQRVAEATPERMPQLKEMAASAFDFHGLEPNYGHEILALLLREGLFEVVTVNWDCAIERAGLGAAIQIAGVANAQQRLQLAQELPLYKVHGCATRPETLALTQSEVDAPQTWALAQVQSALTRGHVVFLGLGTVGLYVAEPIEVITALWAADTTTVHVVDPVLSAQWSSTLNDRADQAYYAATADEFLDHLIRAVVEEALSRAEQSARVLAEHEPWAGAMVIGVRSIIESSKTMTADAVLRWWRDGVADTEAGRTFVVELRGQQALMTVGLIVGQRGESVVCAGARGRMTLSTNGWYYEIACRPGAHFSDVERITRARIERRGEEGVYPDLRPVTVVVVESVGELPAWDAPSDIAGSHEDPNDISGFARQSVRFVAAEDGVRGRLSA